MRMDGSVSEPIGMDGYARIVFSALHYSQSIMRDSFSAVSACNARRILFRCESIQL
jgi:hypothetical protein